MSDLSPPPQYAEYPRANSVIYYGSADRLEALGDGYFRTYYAFAVNSFFGFGYFLGAMNDRFIPAYGFTLFAVGTLLNFPIVKKIGDARGANRFFTYLMAGFIGINAAFCCGSIGYLVLLDSCNKEFRKYGLRYGFYGVRKAAIQAEVDRKRTMEGNMNG